MLIRKSRFLENLEGQNGLYELGFEEWVLNPGMLFGSEEKWWGDGGLRSRPHEGLDLCYYRNKDGAVTSLNISARVPSMYEGQVAQVTGDFLGTTIFVRHDIFEVDRQLHSVYGHILPNKDIESGTIVDEGDIIAATADTAGKKSITPSHLHITVAWIEKSIPEKMLRWETMNNARICKLLDPLELMRCRYTVGNISLA